MQRNSNHYHLYPIITKNNLKDRVLVPHIPQLEQKLGGGNLPHQAIDDTSKQLERPCFRY